MADLRTSFPTLEDSTTNEGVAIHKAVEGETITGKNAAAALVAKDTDGNFAYLRQDLAGNLLVTSDGAMQNHYASAASPVGGSTSKTTVCEISLSVGEVYKELEWSVSNFRDTIYEIEVIDDPLGTPSVVKSHAVLVGSGDFTDSGAIMAFEFDTTGLTSPVLRLSGTNLTNASDFRGSIAIKEDLAA